MTGFVTLLGAGPGDEDLITVKGLERLKDADVLVYDRLVNPALLRHTKTTCERIYVGKIPGGESANQDDITRILIEKAKNGKRVVRLKSGDPYIFGRGGEEGLDLSKANIRFEVVPGVTSAIAGLTYAGIPATYRDIATSLHVITGHLQDSDESLNWDALAQLKGTLVFLMGMKNLPIITQELMARGHSAATPVAIVEWGTHVQQRSIAGTLSTIVDLVEQQGFSSPSLIVVGQVVQFKDMLNFHEQLALFGKRIMVQDSATGKLPRLLKEEGATLVTFPARDKVQAVDNIQLPDFETLTGIVLTDSNSWFSLTQQLVAEQKDIRQLANLKIVTVGHHTAKLVKQSGVVPYACLDYWQKEQVQEIVADGSWLIFAEECRAKDYVKEVDTPICATHRLMVTKEFDPQSVAKGIDVICLPNSVAAETFVQLCQDYQLDFSTVPIVLMGDSTKAVLEKAGFTNFVLTKELTIMSMVQAAKSIF